MSRIEDRDGQLYAVFGPWPTPRTDAQEKFRSDWIHQCNATVPKTPFIETTKDGQYTLAIPLNDALRAQPIFPTTQRPSAVEAA